MKRQVLASISSLPKLQRRALVWGLGAIIIPTILLVGLRQIVPHSPSDVPIEEATGVRAAAAIQKSAWLENAQGEIRLSEYHISYANLHSRAGEPSTYQAPNRAHDFRTFFAAEGIRLQPRTETTTNWEWGLGLVGYGYDGSIQPVAAAALSPTENRITYRRGQITEWYINDERGLEQGFTVGAPPRSAAGEQVGSTSTSLILALGLTGNLTPQLTKDGLAIDFFTADGIRVLRYSDLVVYDANGQSLPAVMRLSNCVPAACQIQLAVNDSGAVYPLTVDPIASDPDWSESGGQLDAHFGYAVAGAGDVNGDGYDDIVVGAPWYDNGESDEGRVFVYQGSASGLVAGAAWTAEGNQTGAEFGHAVSGAGDVNNDGYADIIVGAPLYDNGQINEGQAFVYLGSVTGLRAMADWTAESDQADAHFGYGVATAGDVNNDGYDDVVIGAPNYNNGQNDEGQAYVFHGSDSGLNAASAWTAEGNQAGAGFGYAVSLAGDVNGDGYDDILVGAPGYDNGQSNEGRAFVFQGASGSLNLTPAWTAESNQAGAGFGFAVSLAGDVNGDGYGDVLIGAPYYDNGQSDEGRVYVFHGGSSGLNTSATWMAESDSSSAKLGSAVATTGDVNQDGYDDVIIGAYYYKNGEFAEGMALVYHGAAVGLSSAPNWRAEGNQDYANFGIAVAGAGDVNGDGYDDAVIGAHQYDGQGSAFSYYGSAISLSAIADWTAEQDQQGAQLGRSLSAAGDVNKDGYDDVIIGAPWFDNGQSNEGRVFVYYGTATGLSLEAGWMAEGEQDNALFGKAVAHAGDVNGDGYDDVIIGSEHENGQADEGRATVYHGSDVGLGASADWTAEGNWAGAFFADAVAGAGDINGDGYDDAIIGAQYYDNGQTNEGKVTVYYGSSSGLETTPRWEVESNQGAAYLGEAVSSAGDVNGDGYADIIIGQYGYDHGEESEGGAFVFHGSASGLSGSTPDWSGESDQAFAAYGYAVSSAGDVNNDGYDDVIVGASKYDNGEADEGRAYVYLGAASGLSFNAAWTAEADQAATSFGYAVSTAGDVNGDGYDDILVGAPYFDNEQTDEGQVFLYHGSSSGLSATADWTFASSQAGAYLGKGTGVRNAGDVNGDSYSDIILGAPYYVNGQSREGIVFVFYGSGEGVTSPVANFSADPVSGTAPLTVTFTNTSLNASSYLWQFGDGITSTMAAPQHTYTQAGVYTVTLTAYGAGGLEDVLTKANYISVTETVTPTPTNTGTATQTATPTNTATATPTSTATPTNTPTATPTITPTVLPSTDLIIISPTQKTVEIGSTFTIEVEVANISTPISAYQFDVAYDSSLLYLEKVEDGDFLSTPGHDTACPPWVEPTADSMRLACVGIGPNAGATGDGRLATLTFTALAAGNSDLTLSGVQLADTSVPPASINATLVNGQVTINTNSANESVFVADGNDKNGNGTFLTKLWPSVQPEEAHQFILLVGFTSLLFVTLAYLQQRRRLGHAWRLFIVTGILLQTIAVFPSSSLAESTANSLSSETAINREDNLRNTADLAPSFLPPVVTSQGCYDADVDCDKDVDEADVTYASYSWDCSSTDVCFNIDADIDDNSIVDAFDLAWMTNDYDIDPPQISIVTPVEGEVITGANLAVSGTVIDAHAISQVTVSGVNAAIVGDTFTVDVPVSADSFVLDVLAKDEIGLTSLASRIVTADQSGPMIKIESPPNNQAVYTTSPDIVVSYSDFLSGVDVSSFSAEVRDALGNVIQTFDSSVAGANLAQFALAPLSLGESYTLTASIADEHGLLSVTSSTFYVTDDISIVPPVVPTDGGWISGHVYDSSDCGPYLTTCEGLAGVRVTLMQVDPDALEEARLNRAEDYEIIGQLEGAFPAGDNTIVDTFATPVAGTLLTGPDGFYAFPVDATGVYHLRVEKEGFTYGQREVAAVRERSTAVDEIYLTPIDTAMTLCDNSGCSHTSADGQMTVEIPPGAVPVGDQVEVTATEFDRVYFLPTGNLPPNTGETYAFNLGGSSDYEFQQPITVSIKNSRNFAPGEIIPLGYWNQHTLQWEHEGVATVNLTGEWLVMQVTHFSNHDPNSTIRLSDIRADILDLLENNSACADGEEGCFISLKSGILREWVELPSVNIVGENVETQLVYSSDRANPSAVIDVQLNINEIGNTVADLLTWELYIEGQKTDTFTFSANLDGEGEVGRYRYLWNGRNALGDLLPPGMYAYAVKISIPYEAEYCWSTRGFGDFNCVNGTNTFVTSTKDVWAYGNVALNSMQDSTLGTGWILQDQQFLHEDEAGRILAADGDNLTQYYFDLGDLLNGQQVYDSTQPPALGPASVDFPVTVPSGGTFVSGIIDTDAAWTLAQSPYIVQEGDITVTSGVTLTVEAGVQVMLDRTRNMIIQGNLDAIGTPTMPITFTAFYDGSNSGYAELFDSYQFYSSFGQLEYITALVVDQVGDVWLAGNVYSSYGGNLSIQRLRNDLTTIDEFPLPGSFSGSIIRDIKSDSNGRKWFASDQGILMLAADDTTWTHYTQFNSDLVSNDVRAIAIDNNENQWFALNGGGIQRLSSDGFTWTTYSTVNSGLPTDVTYDLAFDEQGDLWIGTGDGLAQYDPVADSWAIYDLDAGWSNVVEKLDVDLNGDIWITVPSTGIRMLSSSSGMWTSYTSTDGLKDNNVTSIAVDTLGQKWIGHDDGISVLSFDNTTWDYKENVGVAGHVYDFSVAPTAGEIWIAASNTVYRIYSSGLFYDGTIIGGYWGALQIEGSASLSNTTLEMGGVNNQSTLFITGDLNADNLAVRAGGGHGIELANGQTLTLTGGNLMANRGDGLSIDSGGFASLTDVTIQQNKGHGVYLGDGGQLLATRADLIANSGYAIYTESSNTAVTLNEATIQSNQNATRLPIDASIDANSSWTENRHNEIEWHGGTLTNNYTWLAGQGIEQHIVLSDTITAQSTVLTIPAGVSIRFAENAGLTVEGSLTAVGNFDAPIYLGALDPTTTWDGLTLSGSTADLQYVTIQDALSGISATGSVDIAMSQTTIADNDIGIWVETSASVTIAESNLIGNINFAIQNNAGPGNTVLAQDNYWGHPDGPTHSGNPSGQGDVVSDDVDYSGWRLPVLLDNSTIFVENLTATDTSRLAYDPAADTYTRFYPDGRSVHFDTLGRHDYTLYPDDRIHAYTYNPDGTTATLEVTGPGQSAPNAIWTFNYTGSQLDNITDPLGRVIDVTVDSNNQLRQVDIPGMGSRQFYYNQDNLLTQQVDEAGAITSYAYDEYGRILSHTDPTSPVYDPQTGQTTFGGEVRQFTTSDTGYDLINSSAVGDPDNPAPAVPTSDMLAEEVSYGIGGRTTKTNEWGHITEQTDAINRTMTLERDEANRVTRIDLPNGDCIEAEYDDLGNVLSATRWPASECALAPWNRDDELAQTTARTYEPRFNRPKIMISPAGEQIVSYYDYELGLGNAGRIVRIDYPPVPDENGVMTTSSVAYTYNSLGLMETEMDVRGIVTRYIYTQGTPDEAAGGANPLFAPGVTPVPGFITQAIEDDGGFGYVTTYKEFDALGNPQTIIFPGGHQTASTFDALGRLETSTDVNGIVTLYEYDDRGSVTRRVTDYTADGVTGDNVVTTYEYNSDGRLIHERTVSDGLVVESYSRYDINGRLVSESDGQGNETRYIYDDAGQLVETIDATNHNTTYTYTPDGLPETVTDAENHTTRTIYDDWGRVYQTIQAEGELDLTTTYTYTVDNLVTAMEAPDGVVTCFEYDSLHRRTKTIQDCGPDGLNLTTEYAYDLAGNTVYITDTRGIVTYTQYDALGRVTLTRQDDGGLNYETVTNYHPLTGNIDNTVSVDGTVTQYSYDIFNRLEQTCQDSTGLNLCTTYTYDRRGRQETTTDAEGVVQQTVYNGLGLPLQEIADATGLAAAITYEYDNLLNLIRVTDANGNPTQYSYTPRQELETELYADGTAVSYTYTPRGNMHTMTLQDGAVITHTTNAAGWQTQLDFSTGGSQSFGYDTAGRMTDATQTMEGHTTVTGYGYDDIGNVVTTTQQLDGGTAWLTQYSYDYLAGERTITYPSGDVRLYKADNLNRLNTVETGGGAIIADYNYDVINRFNTVAYPASGLTNRQDYDPLGRILQVTVNDGVSNVVDYGYGYDNVGNRTFMQRNHRPGQPADVYEYDDLYQLVNVWYGADATTPGAITSFDANQGYDLDNLGNRLAVTEAGLTEDYGPHNGAQLTNVMNRYESVEGAPLGYDPRGNTLTDGDNVYTYDILNRQTSVSNGSGTTEYIYDPRGRRIAKVIGSNTAHFIYDIQYRVIEERDGSGALLASYTYGQGMDEPLTMTRGGQTYYYHRDALGSVTEVSDSTGAIVERYEYDVYGEVTIFDGSDNVLTASAVGNPYLFTGRQYDLESGNYYYRARYYSHNLGRFLSEDPLGFDAGDYNLYRYVFNNPVNAIDPTGEVAFLLWLVKASAEAAVDALAQGVINYYFDPNITTVSEAINSIDLWQVGIAFITGLLPGGTAVKSLAGAFGDVLLYILHTLQACQEPDLETMLYIFGVSFAVELIGDGASKLVQKYGLPAVAAGFRRLGMDEAAEKLLHNGDEVVDDIGRNLCSFSEETPVATDDGYVAIGDVEIGDRVLAYDEATGEIGYYPVTAVWSHKDPVIVYLTIDGETIETTPEHPFYTNDGQWVPAGELQIGSEVYKADGSYGAVENVAFVYQLQPMYNLTVAAAHTYFVGEEGWLVHNDCDIPRLHRSSLSGPELEELDNVVSHVRRPGRPRPAGHQGKWGETFYNDPDILPGDTSYKEYYVPSPDDPRNVRRIVVGDNGKIYYSNTHYGQNPPGSTSFYFVGGGGN